MEARSNPLLIAKPSQRQPILSSQPSTTTPRRSKGRLLSTHPGLTMSVWGGGGSTTVGFTQSTPHRTTPGTAPEKYLPKRNICPSIPEAADKSIISKQSSKAGEPSLLTKPISAPRLGPEISNSVSLPVREKSGLPSCAREATKPDFVYRKLIRQFHTTASDILLQLLLLTLILEMGL